jgi:hypothetical protein
VTQSVAYLPARADWIFQSVPSFLSVKSQVRGSTRGSRLPTFGM